MANFSQKKAVQEAIEGTGTVVPDGLELPAESVEGILAELAEHEKDAEAHDSDADVLAEDADETDRQLDAVDEADDAAENPADDKMDAEEDMGDDAAKALDVAQESIRKRWNFSERSSVARESYGARNRRKVARESLWSDIKGFLERFWEWLKEQGRKVKDRWLKFSNQGKSMQARSKKNAELIKKLGKAKKDTISGAFIKQLSLGGKFVGDNLADIKEAVKASFATQEVYDQVVTISTDLVDAVDKAVADKRAGGEFKAKIDELDKEMKSHAKTEELLGGYLAKVEVSGEGESLEVSFSFVESEASVPSDIPTPAPSQLTSVNNYFGELGKDVEKRIQAYHATETRRKKFEDAIQKLLKKIDNVKVDDMDKEVIHAVRMARRVVTLSQQAISHGEKMGSKITAGVIAGLNGYLNAGIAAYDKV